MTTLMEKLAAEGVLRCPTCSGPVRIEAGEARCAGCGRDFAFENGALDLYGGYDRSAPPVAVDLEFSKRLAKKLGFPREPAVMDAVARAVAASSLVAGDSAYTAEIAELADRLGIAPPAAAPRPKASAAPAANAQVRVKAEAAYLEPELPAGQEILRTLRIRNLGRTPLSSRAKPNAFLSYHWFGPSGEVVAWEGLRSAFPADIAPGQALSVIARIHVPPPGRYVLRFAVVVEGVEWVDVELGDFAVAVAEAPQSTLAIGFTGVDYDYAEDHAVGIGLVAHHVEALPGTGARRVLEVGAGIHPQAGALVPSGCEVVSADISYCMSQLGALYFRHVDPPKSPRLAFVACDAHRPPFAPASFDCAIMFSALHHFAEPSGMLAALAAVVKPGGFVAAMSEPCMPNPADADYLRDIGKGINEQCWTLQEYGMIFRRARLEAFAGHVDGGSLKVLLRPLA